MAKTAHAFIFEALEDLSDLDLKRFRNQLIDRREEPRVRRSAVQNADSLDLADKLVQVFTEPRAIQVTVTLLTAIGCNNIAKELESKLSTAAVSRWVGALAPLVAEPPLISVKCVPSPDQQATPTSSGLIHCSDGFVQETQKSMKVYPMIDPSKRKRLALLITNIEFENPCMNRGGAVKDEENMENLFKLLGYSVKKYRNLSAQAIDEAVKAFSKDPRLSQTDSVFVVLMSHGKLGKVCGVGWKESDPPGSRDEFPIDDIFKHLNTQNCPALKDKPKVIIIQACRGGNKGVALVSDGLPDDKAPAMNSTDDPSQPATDEGGFVEDALHKAHIEKDFICLLSSTPDNVSYRHPENGSLLIQFIDTTFKEHSHDLHIEDLFTTVMNCFEEFGKVRQMPTKDRCSLTKHFYLLPGH